MFLFASIRSQSLFPFSLSKLSTGARSGCAISSINRTLQCWGTEAFQIATVPITLSGKKISRVSSNNPHTCVILAEGISSDGEEMAGRIECWGLPSQQSGISWGETVLLYPSGVFAQIATGNYHACAVYNQTRYNVQAHLGGFILFSLSFSFCAVF